ncbi:MAG TPA: alpha/beta fold hydrolase [Stellaceae bacterium]|nr:alpha/beta fold hydrolase [Stellaceae bacterium]
MPLALAFAEYGAGPPVVILHGLFGSSRNWTSVARSLAERNRVFTLDLRNHGASPWDDRMDYRVMAEDVAAFLAAQGLSRAALIGHSMGGKVAMVLALTAPEKVDRLVVVDIAPVPRQTTLDGYVEAMRALDLHDASRRGVVDELLRPAVPDDAVRLFLLQNLVPGPEGMRWRINLKAIGRNMPAIAGFPELPSGSVYRGKVLVVRGERSEYVRDKDFDVFRRRFPAFELVTVPGAGHWVHAERPEAFLAAVERFVAE